MTRSRGKNTCEAAETAAAILLQVHRRSEELRFSKASGWPYESDSRENANSRSVLRAMSGVWSLQWITEAPYIVQDVIMCVTGRITDVLPNAELPHDAPIAQ